MHSKIYFALKLLQNSTLSYLYNDYGNNAHTDATKSLILRYLKAAQKNTYISLGIHQNNKTIKYLNLSVIFM